jgi:Secretion system C-terminal sorting domain
MKKIILFILLVSFVKVVSAQKVVSAGGGVKEAGGMIIAYTIGQPTIASGTFSSGTVRIVTGGFEQPEVYSSVETIEIDGKNVEITVSPNPTTNLLRITSDGLVNQNLSLTLTDLKGSIMKTQQFDGSDTTIEVQELPQGLYFLQLSNTKNTVLKSFKIVKQ